MRPFFFSFCFLILAFLSACSHHSDLMSHYVPESQPPSTFQSFDGNVFEYVKWLPQAPVKKVVIGTHGICGIHEDFQHFAEFLLCHSPHTAVYAANLRSQHGDPIPACRGDIRDPNAWYQDLYRFTHLVRKAHPKAEIIWYGESMGAMVSLNSLSAASSAEDRPDKLILSAPVISLDQHLSPLYKTSLTIGANLFPAYRISLDTLAGGKQHQISKDLKHNDEAAMNPYFVKSFTLRFLHIFNKEIQQMHRSIGKVEIPLAIFHGGQDFFSTKHSIEAFLQTAPESTDTRFYHYPEAFHLILYDSQREKIFTDMLDWLNRS